MIWPLGIANQSMNPIQRLIDRLRKPADPGYPEIRSHGDRIEINGHNGSVVTVPWSEVTKILTYKDDHLVVDTIVLEFTLASQPDSPIRISEDWPGFAEARTSMEAWFDSIIDDWCSRVMQPPFERNEAVLWARDSNSGQRP